MNKMKFSASAVFGIILITVGVVSLLSSLDYFDSWDIFSTFWPMIIVLFGVKSLIDHRSSTLFGLVLIGVGAFLQLDELGLWYLGDIYVKELIVPAMIILIGLYFILPKGKKEDERESRKVEKVTPVPTKKVEPEVEDKVFNEPVTEQTISEEAPQEQSDASFTEEVEAVEDKDIVVE